jgi:hypothetical protein
MAGTIKYFYMRMNLIPQWKEILLFCHPTWLPSRDHAKPLLTTNSKWENYVPIQ